MVLCAAGLVLAQQAPAQPPADGPSRWGRSVATPTYGLAVLVFPVNRIEADGSWTELDPIVMPGLDLRIFNGTNVAERGGFYTGWEVGALLFFSPEGIQYTGHEVPVTREKYDGGLNSTFGVVFGLAKYGYRLDIGIDLVGISLGAELGIGLRVVNGSLGLFTEDVGTVPGRVDRDFSLGQASVDVIIDAAAEAALRLGRNFRLLARVGLMITPPFLPYADTGEFERSDAAEGTIGSYDDVEALLSRYMFEIIPIIPTARLGFSVSY